MLYLVFEYLDQDLKKMLDETTEEGGGLSGPTLKVAWAGWPARARARS